MADSFMIYGFRAIMEALDAGKEIDKILIETGLKGDLYNELKKKISNLNIPVQYVPVFKLNKLTGKAHQGVIAYVSPIIYSNIEEVITDVFEKGKSPVIFILDRVTDVRNFGAIARTAECAGVDAIVIPDKGSAQINEDAIKTSAGALLKMNICRSSNLKTTLHLLKDYGLKIVACTEKTDRLIYDCNLKVPVAIILGSEGEGISEEYLKRADERVKIPLMQDISSLNVSVAAGVIVYEAVRQRIAD